MPRDAVIRLQRWGRSIERRVPLLIASILLAAIAVFAVAAYVRARQVLIASAGPRLKRASTQLPGRPRINQQQDCSLCAVAV